MNHYSSFVVKLWVDESNRITRGYIQHVDTQEDAYFITPDRMMAFMKDRLHRPVNGLSSDAGIRVMAQIEESSNG